MTGPTVRVAAAPAADPLMLTGERTMPNLPRENYWFARHEAAYLWVCRQFAREISAAVVVEAGAGEGYGAALLKRAGARAVLALELDALAVRHLAAEYGPEVRAVQANLASPPLRPGSAQVVVSMQVIEHLWDLAGFLRACAGSLAPGGLLVASTPNRLTFSPGLGRGLKPVNPFHVEEFDADQLRGLGTAGGFTGLRVLGLRHGPRLAAWEESHGSITAAQVEAVLSSHWTADLDVAVAAVSADDFVISDHDVDTAHDLILTGRTPAGGTA